MKILMIGGTNFIGPAVVRRLADLGHEVAVFHRGQYPCESPLRTVLFPYRNHAKGPDDFLFLYDKIPVERVVLSDPKLPGTILRLPMVHGPGDTYRRLSPYVKRMDDGRSVVLLDERMARWKCPRGFVDDVAAAVALAVVDERAAGRVFNVAEPVAYTEAEWVRMIGEVVGWRGEVVTVPVGRIPLPYNMEQSLDTGSERIRMELGFAEDVNAELAIDRTIAWERAHPSEPSLGLGLLGYEAEDALLNEIGLRC